MRNLPDGPSVPAGATVTLAPGGRHLMVTGLTAPLVEGEHMDMDLQFEKAGAVRFDILAMNVRGPADGHGGNGMSHDAAGFDQAGTEGTEGDEARITGLLKDMFGTVAAPLSVAPVLVDGDGAVIGRSQADRGGRALLRRDVDGPSHADLCAGDGLKGESSMVAPGSAPEVVVRPAAAQMRAAPDLPSGQVARFLLFDGILHVDRDGGH